MKARSGKITKEQIGDKIKKLGVRSIDVIDEVEGIIKGYIAIWGSAQERDSYDTWFDRQRPPEMDLDLLPIALRYEHGMDGGVKHERIGELYEVGFDDAGIFFFARLDKSGPFFKRTVGEIQHGTGEGKLRTSTGTLNYLADFYEDGAFKVWPVAEVSLTAMPSEARMPDVQLIRSEQGEHPGAPVAEPLLKRDEHLGKGANENQPETKGNRQMNIMETLSALPEGATLEDVMLALMNAGVSLEDMQKAMDMMKPPEGGAEASAASERARFAAALQTVLDQRAVNAQSEDARNLRSEVDKLKMQNALLSARMAAPPQAVAPTGDITGGGRVSLEVRDPYQGNRAYAHLPLTGMMLAYQYLQSLRTANGEMLRSKLVTEGFIRNMMDKQQDRLNAHASGARRYRSERDYYSVRSAVPWRANELMQTDVSGQGQEWVSTGYGTELWEIIRVGRVYDKLVQRGLWEQEITGSTFIVPVEGADPTWYKHSEPSSIDTTTYRTNLDVTPHYVGTSNTTVTPGTAMTRVIITDELKEDSLIDVVAQYQKQVDISAQELVEYLIINADSDGTASTNINLIDGTPNSTVLKPAYLITDGALKLALVTNTPNKRDGSTLSSGDFLETRKLLGNNLAADPANVVYISDVITMLKALELTDVKTKDVFTGATIENGALSGVYGSDYLTSGQMALANSAGKIPAAGGTLGRILAVVPRYWTLGWKRHVQVETARDIEGLVDIIVVSFRLGIRYRTTEASAVSYNLTV